MLISESNGLQRVRKALERVATDAAPGTRLPSVRTLTATHQVSPSTVQRALVELVRRGLVVTRPGDGSFVASPQAPTADVDLDWQSLALGPATVSFEALGRLFELGPLGQVGLASGYLDEGLQPTSLLASAGARASRRAGAWGRAPVEGTDALRSAFAAELGGPVRAHHVLVTSGGQAALSVCFRALARAGQPVVMDSPTYVGAMAAARSAGLSLVPVPTDAEGLRPELLVAALRSSGARLVYCQPRHANPTGSVLAAGRRPAVRRAVADAGAFLVEDDWARDLDLDGRSPGALVSDDPDGHVVYVRSLTKATAPGLRVAALVARGAALARLRAVRMSDDVFVSPVLQEVAVELLTSPAWQRHLRGVRTELQRRRDVLVAAVEDVLGDGPVPVVPRGGLHLWVRLPEGSDDLAIVERMVALGVAVSAGSHWFPAEPSGSFLRLSYASADLEALRGGAKALGEAVHDVHGRR